MTQISSTTQSLMQRISGHNVYEGFTPEFPEDTQGWNSHSPVFRETIELLRPKLIVEIGVWKGACTLHLAQLMREANLDGSIIAIDAFLGSFDPPYNGWVRWRNGRAMLYEQFLSNVVHQKLENYIIPMPQISQYGLATLKRLHLSVDLIHVDASHDYNNVMADLGASWDLLREGGCIIADDFDPSWASVVQAVNDFAKSKQTKVIDRRPKAILRKA